MAEFDRIILIIFGLGWSYLKSEHPENVLLDRFVSFALDTIKVYWVISIMVMLIAIFAINFDRIPDSEILQKIERSRREPSFRVWKWIGLTLSAYLLVQGDFVPAISLLLIPLLSDVFYDHIFVEK